MHVIGGRLATTSCALLNLPFCSNSRHLCHCYAHRHGHHHVDTVWHWRRSPLCRSQRRRAGLWNFYAAGIYICSYISELGWATFCCVLAQDLPYRHPQPPHRPPTPTHSPGCDQCQLHRAQDRCHRLLDLPRRQCVPPALRMGAAAGHQGGRGAGWPRSPGKIHHISYPGGSDLHSWLLVA